MDVVGPFTEQERYSFDLQGFVVRRGVLCADELAEIHHTIDRLDLPTPGAEIASQRFSRFLQQEVFRTLNGSRSGTATRCRTLWTYGSA